MFCRNCGNQMDPSAAVCVKCGVPAGVGQNFCPNCGQPTPQGAAVCVHCGVALAQPVAQGEQKSKLCAGLLGIFLGCFGVHNFYLGYTGKAVAQLLITLLTCGAGAVISEIWGLIEGIMILCGSNITADAKGIPLKD
ncbi:MAG: NINE protein [Acutalibacteraceae bacterium]